jgi:hypothetical protein
MGTKDCAKYTEGPIPFEGFVVGTIELINATRWTSHTAEAIAIPIQFFKINVTYDSWDRPYFNKDGHPDEHGQQEMESIRDGLGEFIYVPDDLGVTSSFGTAKHKTSTGKELTSITVTWTWYVPVPECEPLFRKTIGPDELVISQRIKGGNPPDWIVGHESLHVGWKVENMKWKNGALVGYKAYIRLEQTLSDPRLGGPPDEK